MSVTCTPVPKVLRVTYTSFSDDFIRREAVCFLRPNSKGSIDIMYSHHVDHIRTEANGTWEQTQNFKMELSKATVSEISSHVMHEFWNAFGFNVLDLPRVNDLEGKLLPQPEKQLAGGLKFV